MSERDYKIFMAGAYVLIAAFFVLVVGVICLVTVSFGWLAGAAFAVFYGGVLWGCWKVSGAFYD